MKRFPDDTSPDIAYPTWWTYTVIGVDRQTLESVIDDVVGARSRKVSLSNVSSKGRYTSLTLKLIVLNESERKQIFEDLSSHPAVKVVL